MFWVKATLFCSFLLVCRAHKLGCNITWDGKQMIYKVSPVTGNMTPTEYHWANSTVLATHKNPSGNQHVVRSTADTLVTLICYDAVFLSKHYISKDGFLQEYTANCSTSCEAVTSNQVQVGGGDGDRDGGQLGIGGGIGIGVGVLAVIAFFLCIIFSKFFWTRGTYNPGKRQKSPNLLNV